MAKLLEFASRQLWLLLMLSVFVEHSFASPPTYRQQLITAPDGQPFLKIINDSTSSVNAFAIAEFPSPGMEGHLYYDADTNPQHDQPIPSGGSTVVPLGYFHGSDAKTIQVEVRAIIFDDGSTSGDPAWINAILARRLRLYDRLLGLQELFKHQVGTGLTVGIVLNKLRTAQDESHTQFPANELRIVDDLAFYGAISALQAANSTNVDLLIRKYLAHLEKRIIHLENSEPRMDLIREKGTALFDSAISATAPTIPASTPPNNTAPNASMKHADTTQTTAVVSSCSVKDGTGLVSAPACLPNGNGVGAISLTYDLIADFTEVNANTGQTTKPVFSAGGGVQSGACWAEYVNCSGQTIAAGSLPASPISPPIFTSSGGTVTGINQGSFYWTFFNYSQPNVYACSGCSGGSGEKNVDTADSINDPTTSFEWYFNYACSVTEE